MGEYVGLDVSLKDTAVSVRRDGSVLGAPWEFLQQCTLRNERAM